MCLQKSEKGVGWPGTTVTDDYKPICRWQKLKPGPLKVQQMLLTTEICLQALTT